MYYAQANVTNEKHRNGNKNEINFDKHKSTSGLLLKNIFFENSKILLKKLLKFWQ